MVRQPSTYHAMQSHQHEQMSFMAKVFRWLQRKRYQYEVTFSLYMLTPTEKFIFNSFIFLFFSMILIAASLYLPQHINFLTSRAWYYYHGHDIALTNSPDLAKTSEVIAQTVVETVKAAAGKQEL